MGKKVDSRPLAARRGWPLQADFAVIALLVLLVGVAAVAFVHLRWQAAPAPRKSSPNRPDAALAMPPLPPLTAGTSISFGWTARLCARRSRRATPRPTQARRGCRRQNPLSPRHLSTRPMATRLRFSPTRFLDWDSWPGLST